MMWRRRPYTPGHFIDSHAYLEPIDIVALHPENGTRSTLEEIDHLTVMIPALRSRFPAALVQPVEDRLMELEARRG